MKKLERIEPEGFQDFWSEWQPCMRESDGKPKARVAYTQHILNGANPEDILLAARYHIRKRKEKGSLDWIQLASVWLNAERYEFEAEKEREFQTRLSQAAQPNVVAMRAPVGVRPPNHFLNKYEPNKPEPVS